MIGLCAYFLITAALWSEVNLKTLSLAVWMYPISRALSGLSVVSFRSAKSSGLLRTFQERADRKRTRIVFIYMAYVFGSRSNLYFSCSGCNNCNGRAACIFSIIIK